MLVRAWTKVEAYLRSDRGATMVEYGLMVALIAVVAIAAVTLLGGNVSSKFNQVAGAIGGAGGTP